jgi:hypothetical protein
VKFVNGKLITIGFKANTALLFSYDGKLRPNIKIIPDVEIKESETFFLNLTYLITVSTEDRRLLNKYSGEYNFEIEKDGLPLNEDNEHIYKPVKIGLIHALNKCSGNNTNFATQILPSSKLHPTIENILSDLIRLDFYRY